MNNELNFYSWNIKNTRKSKIFFEDLNAQLIMCEIDILILQECVYQNTKYIEDINWLNDFREIDTNNYIKGSGIKKWVRIFLNKKSNLSYSFPTSYINNKLRCVEITTTNNFKFNLIGVHFYSKAGDRSNAQQMKDNKDIPKTIEKFELLTTETRNTIIVGDINHKPFDTNLIHPDFLNAISDKNIINIFKETKIKPKQKVRFFYNPMWNLLGDYGYDDASKPTGTYYLYPNDVEKFHWNLIDGVLLSPPIMNNIIIKSIKIHTEINNKQLIKTKIDKITDSLLVDGFSDHLPISFTLKTN